MTALNPRQEEDPDAAPLFKSAPEQLHALLNSLIAAKNGGSAGMVAAHGAVVGKWVQHVLQQQEAPAAHSQCSNLVIGILAGYKDDCIIYMSSSASILLPCPGF